MARRGKPSSVSVVLRPPAEVAEGLRHLFAASAGNEAAVEAVNEPAQVVQHVGPTPKGEYPQVIESIRRAASGLTPFELRVVVVRTLPEGGPARSIAAMLDAPPTLLELKRRLAQRLARKPRADPADRFTPHVTLGRLNLPGAIEPFEMSVDGPAFRVESVALARTRITPMGATVEEIAQVGLG